MGEMVSMESLAPDKKRTLAFHEEEAKAVLQVVTAQQARKSNGFTDTLDT